MQAFSADVLMRLVTEHVFKGLALPEDVSWGQ